MKTINRTVFCAFAAILAAVSCQKSIKPENPADECKRTIDICVNGLMGEYAQADDTKASLVNNIRVSWEGGETVYVYDGTQCLGSLAASLEGDEDRYALLSTDGTHTVAVPAEGTKKLTLVYCPLINEAPAVEEGAISISLDKQAGEKAPFVAYATLDYTGTSITDAIVPFKFATSVIRVSCTGLKESTAIASASLSNVNTACRLSLSGTAAPVVAGESNGTITRTGDAYFAANKVNSDGEAVFQIAVPVLETAAGLRFLTLVQGSSATEDLGFTTKSLAASTTVNTVCQLRPIVADALTGVFSVQDGNGQSVKKIHFSKGNLTYNVQDKAWAFYEHQYDRAEWYDSQLISLFTWGLSDYSVMPDTNNYVEGHTAQYDTFSRNEDWGYVFGGESSVWRTLTIKEWQYLLDGRTVGGGSGEGKCYKRARINSDSANVYGIILYPDNYTAQSDAESYTSEEWTAMETAGCVFLPAAGLRSANSVSNTGTHILYWSSSSCKNGSAYCVYFRSDLVELPSESYRNLGYSVRLITTCM